MRASQGLRRAAGVDGWFRRRRSSLRGPATVAMLVSLSGGAACGGDDAATSSETAAIVTDSLASDDATSVAPVGDIAAAPACEGQTITITTDTVGNRQVSEPTLPDDDHLLAAAVAESFCTPTWTVTSADGTEQQFRARPVLPAEDASCIGIGLVEDLGAARVRQLTVLGTAPWSALGFGLSQNNTPTPVTRTEAEAITDVFAACSDGWKLLLVLSVTGGADQIGDDSADCVSGRVSDQEARTMLIAELDRAYDDPTQTDATPFPDVIAPLVAAFEECLTPREKAGVDFS